MCRRERNACTVGRVSHFLRQIGADAGLVRICLGVGHCFAFLVCGHSVR